MSTTPANDQESPDGYADKQSDAMKDQLRKDVASWSAARSEGSARQTAELSAAAVKQPSQPPAARAKRAKPAAPSVAKTAQVAKKPFSMSYDGVTEAEYITYMIARGAR